MKILLSPAKNIDSSKTFSTKEYSIPVFQNEAESLVSKLRKFSVKKIADLMHLSTDLAELNVDRYAAWKPISSDKDGGVYAGAVFNGEVYRGLNATQFDESTLRRAQDELRILSGLYGILKPLDLIHPYRLEMGTSWAVTPTKKNLYAFWGDKIVDELNKEESELIVNLASTEYFKAIPNKKLKAKLITPVFKEFKNGKYQVVMVYAKQARGMMANYILSSGLTDPEEIKGFDREGYRFDANLSTDSEWVFTR
ncbi:MAG: peroxide stress protein YaaA [Bacteroidetes bacterium]|nr:MAG: peroxide stress protein YaaA [Bacteroidota bacterium]